MKVKDISLHNYRNYERLDLSFHRDLNIFLGENAQGKTNVIEAIYYAAMGHSHRASSDGELIRWNELQGSIQLAFERADVENNIKISFFNNRPKVLALNGHVLRPKEMIGSLNAVLFSPEDLFLIKGAPAGRRRFLDLEISQANPSYYQQLSKYNRIVSQRNILLKKIRERKASANLLEPWDAQLVFMAGAVIEKRLQSVRKLNMLANLMHRKITDNQESLEIRYVVSGLEGDIPKDFISWYNKKLNEFRDMDIVRGSTNIGPHRDDMAFKVNQIDLRTFGSQGQQRTGVLALKLAELEFIRSETGEYPILLLDDVMSELDQKRREQLLLFIKEKIQTFITATDRAYFPKEKMGKYYYVASGRVLE